MPVQRGGALQAKVIDITQGLFGETLYELRVLKKSRKPDIRTRTIESLK